MAVAAVVQASLHVTSYSGVRMALESDVFFGAYPRVAVITARLDGLRCRYSHCLGPLVA